MMLRSASKLMNQLAIESTHSLHTRSLYTHSLYYSHSLYTHSLTHSLTIYQLTCSLPTSDSRIGGASSATASDGGGSDSYSDQHLVRAGEAVDRAVQVLVGKCSSVGGTSRKYEVAQRYFPGMFNMLCCSTSIQSRRLSNKPGTNVVIIRC